MGVEEEGRRYGQLMREVRRTSSMMGACCFQHGATEWGSAHAKNTLLLCTATFSSVEAAVGVTVSTLSFSAAADVAVSGVVAGVSAAHHAPHVDVPHHSLHLRSCCNTCWCRADSASALMPPQQQLPTCHFPPAASHALLVTHNSSTTVFSHHHFPLTTFYSPLLTHRIFLLLFTHHLSLTAFHSPLFT